jgi:hypothetical protein
MKLVCFGAILLAASVGTTMSGPRVLAEVESCKLFGGNPGGVATVHANAECASYGGCTGPFWSCNARTSEATCVSHDGEDPGPNPNDMYCETQPLSFPGQCSEEGASSKCVFYSGCRWTASLGSCDISVTVEHSSSKSLPESCENI